MGRLAHTQCLQRPPPPSPTSLCQLPQRAAAAPAAMAGRPTLQSRSQSAPDVYPYQYDRYVNDAPSGYVPPPPATPVTRVQVRPDLVSYLAPYLAPYLASYLAPI